MRPPAWMMPSFTASGPCWPYRAGSLMMLSTPYGKRGVFYEEWTGGEGWERYEVPASECPRIPVSFLEEERASLPARIYRQEHSYSFEDVEDAVFGYDL